MSKQSYDFLPETQIRLIEDARETKKFYYSSIPFTQPWICAEIVQSINIDVDDDIAVMFTVEWALWLKHNGYKNITVIVDKQCDFTQKACEFWDFEYKIYNTGITMKKFDVVLLNPPYQDGKNKIFYRQFVAKSFDLAKKSLGVIIPASWNSGGMTDFKRSVINNGLKEYFYLGNKAFKDSQNDVCYFICEKGYSGDVVVKNYDGQVLVKDIDQHGIMPHKNLEATDLLIKLSKFKGSDSQYQRGVLNPEKFSSGSNKFVVRNGSSNKPFEVLSIDCDVSTGYNQHKIIIPYNSSIGNIGPAKYADKTYSIGYAVACFCFDSRIECDNFEKYLSSKLVKFVIKNLKTSIQNAKNIFEKVPYLDMKKTWEDTDLYKHFNLSEEEIAFIESNC
jgi:site-specific DNA-methyltransferase (adenine-specific)